MARFGKAQELLFELKVADVMQHPVISLAPGHSMHDLRQALHDHRISGVPVVDGDSMVGIISTEDLIRWLLEGGGSDTRVADRMTHAPVSLYADQPVAEAIRRLDEARKFGRFPVIERASGALVGIITKGDIIEALLHRLEDAYAGEEQRQYEAHQLFEEMAAEEKRLILVYEVVGKDFDRAGKASTQMKRNLKRLGLRPELVRRLAIASYEAEMNVVIHADHGRMRFEIAPEWVSLRVRDRGPGIEDIEQALEPGYSTSPDWVKALGFGAGMGLANIRQCADTFELESTPGVGTCLRIRIRTKEDHEAA